MKQLAARDRGPILQLLAQQVDEFCWGMIGDTANSCGN